MRRKQTHNIYSRFSLFCKALKLSHYPDSTSRKVHSVCVREGDYLLYPFLQHLKAVWLFVSTGYFLTQKQPINGGGLCSFKQPLGNVGFVTSDIVTTRTSTS